MKKSDLFFRGARKVDETWVERLNPAAGEIFEKAAKSDEMIGLSESGEVLV